ncbi:MFS transporter [Kitasatospora paranensis]|uniref:MFS transporter n=1 Tax=Kitasatospora paranensis TaxID=258053 RepID=A0ABW2G086_9ACTN
MRGRAAVLGERDFRIFLAGFTASQLGTGMATVALVFAVLERSGSPAALGWVMAARVLPMTVLLLGGGVAGDRLPRRLVMLGSDVVRVLAQAGVAALLLLPGAPPLGALLPLVALGSAAEAFFAPSLDGIVPSLVPAARRHDANVLLGMGRSAGTVAGPVLAGLLVAVTGPAPVLAFDALTFALSALALAALRTRPPAAAAATGPRSGLLADLRAGRRLFFGTTWLWAATLQAGLFNLVLWAPYLVLGPVASLERYGGARAWGLVVGCYGAGSVLGALALLGRRARRPLVAATVAGLGYAAPAACLALAAPLPVVAAGGVLAGVAQAVSGAQWSITLQSFVPAEALSRVGSYVTLGAFVLGPVGLAAAGPLGRAAGVRTVLAVGVLFHLVSNTALLALSSVRGLRLPEVAAGVPAHRGPAGPGADRHPVPPARG